MKTHELKIISLIIEGKKNATSIAKEIGTKQPTVSAQLYQLEERGIIKSYRDGQAMSYKISGFAKLAKELGSFAVEQAEKEESVNKILQYIDRVK